MPFETHFLSDDYLIMLVVTAGLAALLFTVWYSYHLALRPGPALVMAALVQALTVIWLIVAQFRMLADTPLAHQRYGPMMPLIAAVAFLGLMGFGVGLLAKVYRACVMNNATDAEREPGMKSLRVWLGPMNVLAGAGVVVGAYYSLGWSPLGTGMVVCGAAIGLPRDQLAHEPSDGGRSLGGSVCRGATACAGAGGIR